MDEFALRIAAQLQRRGIADTGLVDEKPITWKEVITELDRRADEAKRQREAKKTAVTPAQQPQGVVEQLRAELEKHRQDSDVPGLNGPKLLELAAGTALPHSTRESVAALLRDHWDKQQPE